MEFLVKGLEFLTPANCKANDTSTCCVFSTVEANETFMQILATVVLVVRILQIVIPIALIVWGTIDLGKAVIAGDEKKIKENQGKFVKRIISAVLVFLVPFIVSLIMNFLSPGTWNTCYKNAKNHKTIENNDTIKDFNY